MIDFTELVAGIVALWAMMRLYLGAGLVLTGGVLAIIGAIGVLRFPDFYTRLHAASVTDTAAAFLALTGMAMLAPDMLVVFKLGAVGLFLFLTTPTSTHALANAAYTAGLEPVTGSGADAARRDGDS